MPRFFENLQQNIRTLLEAQRRRELPAVPFHHSPYFAVEPKPFIAMGSHAMTVVVLELAGSA